MATLHLWTGARHSARLPFPFAVECTNADRRCDVDAIGAT